MNKKVKRILLLIALMFAATLAIHTNKSYAAECTMGNYTYAYDVVDGKAENVYISKYNGGDIPVLTVLNIRIPDELDGYSVNSIGNGVTNILNKTEHECIHEDAENTYSYNVTVELPSALESINDYALSCLEVHDDTIIIPNTVKYIRKWAFANTHFRRMGGTLTIPDSVERIEDYAFANLLDGPFSGNEMDGATNQHVGSGITNFHWWRTFPYRGSNLVIGSNVKIIGAYAFLNNQYYSNVTIPTNVTAIGPGAFLASGFNSINITQREDSNELAIGSYAFAMSNITSFNVQKAFIINPDVPNQYVGIGICMNCKNLQTATFADGHTSIPHNTFSGCVRLNNVTKTDSITSIGSRAFAGCRAIDNQEYHDIVNNNITSIGNEAFLSCTGITGDIIVPSSITPTDFGFGVFENCTSLNGANIQVNLTEIPKYTFFNCTSLTDITKPNTVNKIGDKAFYDCTSLTTTEYDDIMTNITTLGDYVFSGCTGLTGKVIVEDNVSQLGVYVFSRCSNIESAELKYSYTSIPDGTFCYCSNLTDVTKSSSVKKIGERAFYRCTSLDMEEYNDIATNIEEFGTLCFEGDTGLSGTLNIKASVKVVGKEAFKNCTNVTNITFEEPDYYEQIFNSGCFQNAAPDQEIYRMYATVIRVCGNVFTNAKEIFTNANSNSSFYYKWNGEADTPGIIHYGNCKHKIDITCTLPGISLVDPTTEQKLSTFEADCESDFQFKLKIDEGYESRYADMVLKVISEGRYADSELVETRLDIENGKTYTLENIIRNKQIIVLARENGTDLVLRQFISEINNEALKESRAVNVKLNRNGISTFDYNHTKYPVAVKEGDSIKYTIRVYNEGTAEGEANKIKVRLQNGISYDDKSATNNSFGWNILEDGTLETEYLRGKNIPAFAGGKPQYEEVELECKVTATQTGEEQYLVSIAEIASGNDIDSAENTIGLIDLTDYKKDESYLSAKDTYTMGEEDDTDHEAVVIRETSVAEYCIVVNKIDSLSSELLNGAKINLIDKDKTTVLQTAVTRDGKVTFGGINTYGEGTDIYYLEEEDAPEGYTKTIDGLIELQVVKKENNEGHLEISEVIYDADCIDEEDDVEPDIDENKEFIPISTKEQLLKIGSGEQLTINGTSYVFAKEANYRLMQDINMNSENITPIKYMNGIFDGNNHSITNLKIQESEAEEVLVDGISMGYRTGLFRVFKGEIRNLTVNIDYVGGVSYSEAEAEKSSVGGIVGYMISGTIKNCNVTGDTITSDCQNVGGFVGESSEDMTVFKDCTTAVKVLCTGKYNVGGIIGCSGDIKVTGCTSQAVEDSEIQGALYNVGGIIGCAKGYTIVKESANSRAISLDNGINIGGIIGCTLKNSTTNIEDCENNAGITGTLNIGGIVGNSEGVINIIRCNNAGQISAVKSPKNGYNAGGIIGKSCPVGNASANANIQIADDGRTIKVFVRNKKVKQQYDLNVIKVDLTKAQGQQTLTGAKFNVYNSNGQLIREQEEVESDGILRINDIPLDFADEEIYYIEEVEAPSGYNILVEEPVKVVVRKQWDKNKQKYILSITASLDEVTEQEEEEEQNEEPQKINVSNTTYDNVRYKSNKTAIAECTNTGEITGISDCGGIAGCIMGNSIVEDCENNGQSVVLSSGYVAGGIVGDLMQTSSKDESTISNCTNNAALNGSGNSFGGIVGVTTTITDILDCTNNGKIQGSGYCAGGIAGRAVGIINIDNCMSNDDINGFGMVGGIVANSLLYNCPVYDYTDYSRYIWCPNILEDSITITNCNVSAQVFSGSQVGGVLGSTSSKYLNITGCTVSVGTISGSTGSSGGILGIIDGQNTVIENCKVLNATISAGSASGIAGGYCCVIQRSYISSDTKYKKVVISVNDCEVLGCIISGNGSGSVNAYASGILPAIDPANTQAIDINVTGCTVGAYNDKKTILYARTNFRYYE